MISLDLVCMVALFKYVSSDTVDRFPGITMDVQNQSSCASVLAKVRARYIRL